MSGNELTVPKPERNVKSAGSRHNDGLGDSMSIRSRQGSFLQTGTKGGKDMKGLGIKSKLAMVSGQFKSNSDIGGKGIVVVEPTYKTEPDDGKKFGAERVEKSLYSVLEKELEDVRYDAATAPRISCRLGNVVKKEVTDMKYDRYKYVVHVMLGQNTGQGLQAASRCLFYDAFDSYASAKYENDSIFATVTVYALYMD